MYKLRADWKEHTLPFLRISDKARQESNFSELVDPNIVQRIRELTAEGASISETCSKTNAPRRVIERVRRGRL